MTQRYIVKGKQVFDTVTNEQLGLPLAGNVVSCTAMAMNDAHNRSGAAALLEALEGLYNAAKAAGLIVSDTHFQNARDKMSVEYRDLYHAGRIAAAAIEQARS